MRLPFGGAHFKLQKMTLPFSRTYKDGSENYFPQRILKALEVEYLMDSNIQRDCFTLGLELARKYPNKADRQGWDMPPKYHTIRADKSNRWSQGKKIHFCINNRQVNRFQFAPVVPVRSIQSIRIDWSDTFRTTGIKLPWIFIDEELLPFYLYGQLAVNDGFPNFSKFLDWFSEDFEGKIIHWTHLKYTI